MRYTTLLLDLDHTLLDSHASEAAAFDMTMRAIGVDDPAAHFSTYVEINTRLWNGVEAGTVTPDEVAVARFVQLIETQGLEADPEQMAADFRYGLGANGELYEGVRDVLDHLAASAAMAIVTNGVRQVQLDRVERLGLAQYFDAVVISGEVGASKPSTEIFDITFELMGAPAKDTALMVGDSLSSDIRGGTNYDIDTCWYNAAGKVAGADDRVTHEIATIGQLPGIVGTQLPDSAGA